MDTAANFVQFVNTQAGRWEDFLHIQLESGIESACKHSMILSHLPDYGLRGGMNLLIQRDRKLYEILRNQSNERLRKAENLASLGTIPIAGLNKMSYLLQSLFQSQQRLILQ